MQKLDTSTPVVVLRALHQGGLGIVRSLGRLGVPVYVVDNGPWTPAFFSRHCRGRIRKDLERSSAGDSAGFLLDRARKIGRRPILIPTTDETALFVADNANALKECFLFPDQSPETAHALASKQSMFRLARALGIPTPETFFPRSRLDAIELLEAVPCPLVLKAIDCARQRRLAVQTKAIASDRHEFLELYDRMQDPQEPNLIIQEYIPGGDDSIWMFNGYFNRDSKCLFGMTGKKIRQNPVYTGSSCLAICLHNDLVERLTLHFMESVGYRGILDIGYRYDARDGTYKVLDVNPRIGSTFRLFVGDNGMDVARALYLDLTGQTVPVSQHCEGRKWIVEDWDLVSSLRYYFDGKLAPGEWIRSFRGVQETSFLSLGDPLPILPVLLQDVYELAKRSVKRFRHPNRTPRDVHRMWHKA
jgi:D-aspartate ligase